MTIGKRILDNMKEQQISEGELARRSGVPQPTIHRIVAGDVKSPRNDNIEKIAKALNLNFMWLVTGKESKHANPNLILKSNKDDLNTISIPILIDLNNTTKNNHFNILVGVEMNIENLKKLANFTDPEKLTVFSMNDSSMTPNFNEGDWLLIDKNIDHINSDGLYLVNLNNLKYIRRFQLSPDNELLMIADNKSYKSFTVNKNNLTIIGKAIYAWNGRRI